MEITIKSTWILLLILGSAVAQDERVTGLIGQNIKLECKLSITDNTRVKWVDWVYNQERDPSDIYDTSRGTLASDHPNVANFHFDPTDYSLTINNLKMDSDDDIGDAGEYICQTVSEQGSQEEYTYQLDVAGRPECSDDVDLVEGESTKLTCSISYSGSQMPELRWYQGDEEVTSEDMSNIGIAQRDASIDSAHWAMDGKTYTCRVGLNGFEESCSLDMTVKYMVRNLKLSPENGPLRVNDEVVCSANGNPTPMIEIEVSGAKLPQISETEESRSFTVPKSWQGKDVEISCSASNNQGNVAVPLQLAFHVEDDRIITTQPEVYEPETTEAVATQKPTKAKRKKTTKPMKAVEVIEAATTPVPTPQPTNKPKDPKTGSTNIAGIIAAFIIVALVVIVIVIAIVCIKRKNSNKPKGAKPVPTKEEEVRAMETGKGADNNGTPRVTYSKIDTRPDPANTHKPNGNVLQSPLLNPGQSDPNTIEEEAKITYADLDFENQGTNTGIPSSADNSASPGNQSPLQRHPSNDIVYSDIQTDANK